MRRDRFIRFPNMLHWLIVLSLLNKSTESIRWMQPVHEDVTKDFKVMNCVNMVMKRHFPQTQNVEIISSDNVYNGFEDFAIVIRSNSTDFEYPDVREMLTSHAVVFLNGTDEPEQDIETLSTLVRSDPQGRFIISFKSEVDPRTLLGLEYLNRIVTYLAQIERWNVVILINAMKERKIRMYSYTLFAPGNCSRTPRLFEVGNCDDKQALNNLFPVFPNFHKCQIRMFVASSPPQVVVIHENEKVLDIHGIEVNVLKLIIQKLNATAEMSHAANGPLMRVSVQKREMDMTWSNMLQDITAGNIWTQSYIFVQSVLVVPRNRLMPLWMNIILPFQAEVWATLGMVLALHLVIQLLIPSIRRQFHIKWMLSSFFGSGISRLPTRIPQRLYVAYWLIVGYIVTQCYLASLTGFFASPGQYRPMQTLNEVDESGIVVGGISHMRNQFREFNPGIYRNFKVLSNVDYFDNLKNLKEGKGGVATYAPRPVIMNITINREVDFNTIPEYVSFYPIATLLPNSSYILEGCNRVINHIRAAGLIQFWEDYEAWELKYASQVSNQDTSLKTSLEHVQGVFVILAIGLFLSCIIFAVEITSSKYSKAMLILQ